MKKNFKKKFLLLLNLKTGASKMHKINALLIWLLKRFNCKNNVIVLISYPKKWTVFFVYDLWWCRITYIMYNCKMNRKTLQIGKNGDTSLYLRPNQKLPLYLRLNQNLFLYFGSVIKSESSKFKIIKNNCYKSYKIKKRSK